MILKPSSQGILSYEPSGSLDHARQEAARRGDAASHEGFVAPRTPIEGQLARIWTQVLGIEHIGVRDHFQDLGGRSLHATQIFSRLKSDMGINFPRSLILTAPTIELMASCIETLYYTKHS
ncbi:MAG TPA: phosphopantetheine-binding protein [Ktedonosporobacter sp.]|jgi:acyl carrier protein|nr:phosphopantetheine-binding protein [Ktedonosporobacter sp.]